MARKKTADDIVQIGKLIESKRVVIGAETTIKNLKSGKLEKIYLAKNCPADVSETINYLSKIAKVGVIELSYANDELGVICKKPFSISVLSVLKV